MDDATRDEAAAAFELVAQLFIRLASKNVAGKQAALEMVASCQAMTTLRDRTGVQDLLNSLADVLVAVDHEVPPTGG